MKTIKGKILLAITLIVSVTLLVLGVVSVVMNYTSSTELVEQTMTEMAEIAAERIEQELNAYLNVATDAGCTARLADEEQSAKAKQTLINQRAEQHGLIRGNVLDSTGKSLFDGNDYSDRVYFQTAMQGRTCVSEPVISKITGELSIIISAPLWANGVPNTRVVGVVYFVPPETFLNDIVSSIDVSENGSAYMIAQNGYTVADTTLETITTQNIEQEAQSDASLSQLAAIHAKMRAGEAGYERYTIGGVSRLAAYAPVGSTDGWSLAISAPVNDFMASTISSIIITAIILIVSVLIAALVGLRIANAIGMPIRTCAERLDLLAKGDLSSEVPQVTGKDETATLANATGSIVSTMHGIINDITWGLGEMAQGNFTVMSSAADLYVGDFQPLSVSMYNIMQEMSVTLSQIDESADQVSSGSDQVSSSAQALSQGATEQASSVQELAATINEISQQVQDTAQNADVAREKTAHAGDLVNASNGQMQEMMTAMSDISEKSSEIGKIIKTIEDIAFQTNILALNAAVEAARAGAAGKGFAVVADEVRSLAGKSAEASKNTAAMIDDAIQAIERGTSLAGVTAESLNDVVSSAQEVVVAVDKIAAAATQQAQSVAQVTQGIDQISSVVQTNSATAEESAAASEELSGQAQMLKDLVGRFQLSNNIGNTIAE